MAFQQYPQKFGIPSGNTAGRPSSPIIGDTYYNGQLEILEIFNGTIWVAASAPPATPQLVSVTDVGNIAFASGGSFNVLFAAGSGGGTPSQYNAFTTAGGFSASSFSTTVSLTGLTVGTSFTVYGNAQNNFGTTVNTPNAAAVTATTLPEIRTIGTATASGSANEITVTWTNGNNGGKNLSAITITPFLNGTTAETSRTAATTSSTSYTFTAGQLTAGASYTFKVKATNANGTCADSTATNSATMPNFIDVDFLVIAGGGGGGRGYYGGGGGAGGYRTSTATSGGNQTALSPVSLVGGTAYTITVGAGGTTPATDTSVATNGGNSVFATITSTGGGGGSSRNGAAGNLNAAGGGSGGGGSMPPSQGGARTASPIQGFNGGNCNGSSYGASGGGASAAGNDGLGDAGNYGAIGPAGLANSITGTSVVRGGGGAGGGGGTRAGGDGGGGSTPAGGVGGNGTVNTGGGAGGGSDNNSAGGSGGSGIVIIKISDTRSATFSGGVTSSLSTAVSGFKVYTITAAGVSDTVTIS